jgi:hypothetical protein
VPIFPRIKPGFLEDRYVSAGRGSSNVFGIHQKSDATGCSLGGTIVAATKVDARHPSLGRLAGVIFLFLIWLMAAWSNATLFLEETAKGLKPLRRARRLFKVRGHRGWEHSRRTLLFIFRYHKSAFVEAFVVPLVVEFGLAVVVANSVQAAKTLAKAMA